MDQQNNNQTTPPAGLLTDEQKNGLFTELGLDNLPDDKKAQLMDTMIDTVLNRIFERILPSLTEADEQMLADLELRPDADQSINEYLVSRVPNLDVIAQEEVVKFREEMKDSVAAIKSALSE